VSPEGKFPMRQGTQDDPTAYIEGWRALTTGVDREAPLSDFYAEDVINGLIEGSNNFARWGFIEGQGELVTAVYTTLIVPQTLDEVLAGSLSAEEGATTMQELADELGKDAVARSRVIHAQTMQEENYQRFAELGIIAEVNPTSLEDDMRWVIRRLGPEREKLSHPYKSFVDNGVMIVGGSDIPGAQGATFKCHPKYVIHAAVNRTGTDGMPEGGWLPEQRLSVHEAIKMHTRDAVYATFDEDVRGTIVPGKLADLTIADRNLLEISPDEILDMEIVMTVVDGRVVYERDGERE